MYDTGKVIIGILVFLGLITFPIWSPVVVGKAGPLPELEKVPPEKGKECVEATAFMRTSHMTLLNNWREWVVRDGKRLYKNQSGKEYVMSLQNTCFDCHKNKEKFCDRCHNFVSNSPKCWECHIYPEFRREEQKTALRSE